jgi:hypothetical protein
MEQQRFWDKVDQRGEDECWPWKAGTFKTGYGCFHLEKIRTSVTAHRMMWKLVNGHIPEGMYVCHHCDNRLCVNPDHLFLGTHADNMRDMGRKGRTAKGPGSGSFVRRKLSDENVRWIRSMKGKALPRELAEHLGVATATVWCVQVGRSYRDVE